MVEAEDGTLSEITILPDGRVYIFGMTLPLLEMLATLPTREGGWQTLLAQFQAATATASEKESVRE